MEVYFLPKMKQLQEFITLMQIPADAPAMLYVTGLTAIVSCKMSGWKMWDFYILFMDSYNQHNKIIAWKELPQVQFTNVFNNFKTTSVFNLMKV